MPENQSFVSSHVTGLLLMAWQCNPTAWKDSAARRWSPKADRRWKSLGRICTQRELGSACGFFQVCWLKAVAAVVLLPNDYESMPSSLAETSFLTAAPRENTQHVGDAPLVASENVSESARGRAARWVDRERREGRREPRAVLGRACQRSAEQADDDEEGKPPPASEHGPMMLSPEVNHGYP
jgi:hypothetical protein